MADITIRSESEPLQVPGILIALGHLFGRLPIRLLGISFAANVLSSLPFLLDRSSGTNAAWSSFPLDDSWIHLAYVRGLATQFCLCYNEGVWEAGATSWGWALLQAPFYVVGHLFLGVKVVLIVKMLGIAVGAVCTALAYRLVMRITSNRIAAVAVAAAITLEPTWAFGRVSGMEIPLITTLVFGSALALMYRRWTLAGFLLGFGFWARPEAGVYAAAAITFMAMHWAWQPEVRSASGTLALSLLGGRRRLEAVERARLWQAMESQPPGMKGLLRLSVFPAVMLLMWILYNQTINGTIYPNTYLTKFDPTLPLIPIENMTNMWNRGMVSFQSWLSGWKLAVTGVLYVLGAFWIVRRAGSGLAAFVLFPALLLFGVGSGLRYFDAPFDYTVRRYIDPATPLTMLVIGVGITAVVMRAAGIVPRAFGLIRPGNAWPVPIAALLGVYGGFMAVDTFNTHRQLTYDYSWNAQNIYDEDELMGLWLKENADPDATVMVADAGAVKYLGGLFVYDVFGLNTNENIGRPAVDIAIDGQADYIAIWEEPRWDEFPNAEKVARFTTPNNTILGGGPAAIYEMDWSKPFVEADEPLTLGDDLVVIDHVNMTERESELMHRVRVPLVSFAPNVIGELGGTIFRDRGVSHAEALREEFWMATAPGRDVTLALRYRNDNLVLGDPPTATVLVDGQVAGPLDVAGPSQDVVETSMLIPGSFITRNPTQFEIDWDGLVTEFRWWTIDAGEGELDVAAVQAAALDTIIAEGLIDVPPRPLPRAAPERAVVFDDFDVADDTDLAEHRPGIGPTGAVWESASGLANWRILDGAVFETSREDGRDHRLVIDAGIPNAQIEADVTWNGWTIGLVLRYVDERNWVMVWWDGAFVVIAQLTDASGFRELGRFRSFAWQAGEERHVLARVTGPRIAIQIGDKIYGPIADADLLDGTTYGVLARSPVPNAFDNFTVSRLR